MTALTLLILCVAAQVLIALGLGIFFLRRYLHQRRERKDGSQPGNKPSGGER